MSKRAVVLALFFPFLAVAAPAAEPDPGLDLGALGFGLGIGVEHYKSSYIDEASTNGTNRVVNIDKQYNTNPSAWLTMSWSFPKKKGGEVNSLGSFMTNAVNWGLFAGVKVIDGGDGKAFNGFAIGPQVTFKTGTAAAPRDISVGIGAVTHKVRGLATGIEEGKPLPSNYTDIKYREKSEWNWMIMLSVSI
jgi:hypothetical protein